MMCSADCSKRVIRRPEMIDIGVEKDSNISYITKSVSTGAEPVAIDEVSDV